MLQDISLKKKCLLRKKGKEMRIEIMNLEKLNDCPLFSFQLLLIITATQKNFPYNCHIKYIYLYIYISIMYISSVQTKKEKICSTNPTLTEKVMIFLTSNVTQRYSTDLTRSVPCKNVLTVVE